LNKNENENTETETEKKNLHYLQKYFCTAHKQEALVTTLYYIWYNTIRYYKTHKLYSMMICDISVPEMKLKLVICFLLFTYLLRSVQLHFLIHFRIMNECIGICLFMDTHRWIFGFLSNAGLAIDHNIRILEFHIAWWWRTHGVVIVIGICRCLHR